MAKETVLHDIEDIKEKVILVAVDKDSGNMSTESCLDELEELVKTAGGEVVGRIIQKEMVFMQVIILEREKLKKLR